MATHEEKIPELTLRVFILAIILTILLAISNAYLALRLGILASASIPAAIISMGILRFFKNASILENNAVQTAASAGEAIAGGVVYTLPALVIIKYWYNFDYFSCFFIALSGGILGVLFSIPLRRILVNDKKLKFPEGMAIAEVLKTSAAKLGISDIFLGGLVGALLELMQTGFKLISSSYSYWFVAKRTLFGIGAGFSATMIGAGYLVGFEMALSIFIGAILSWLIAFPLTSQYFSTLLEQNIPEKAASLLWDSHMRYLGIGAMLCAGIVTFIKLVKPLSKSIAFSFNTFITRHKTAIKVPRTDKDMPAPIIFIAVLGLSALLFLFLQWLLPLEMAGMHSDYMPTVVFAIVLYILIMGFLASVITAYFSGIVGVTASPGSSIMIASILFAAWLLFVLLRHFVSVPLDGTQMQAAEAITIIIGSVITGIAAIANDNSQDLKVGQLVGATPWRQQIMLLLGVLISSLVIPPVMQLLFEVYGIAGVMPREGMDITLSLPAPTAALMAAITEAVFRNSLPWTMMLIGASIILGLLVIERLFKIYKLINISILGVSIGMYLPISSSFPLFIGGVIALIIQRRVDNKSFSLEEKKFCKQKGVLIACGLVAGSALMDVFLAIPFSLFHSPQVLQLVNADWQNKGAILGVITTVLLGWWINKRVFRSLPLS